MAKALVGRPLVTFPKPDPESSSNPMVSGELVQGEYHEILYYLSRVNDYQFNNWEEGVKRWLLTNSVDINKFKATASAPIIGTTPSVSVGDVGVTINSPGNGGFVADTITVNADAYSSNKVAKLEIYLNGNLIDSKIGDLGQSYKYIASLKPNNLDLQNVLIIRVTDASGIQSSKQVILYKNL
ncbi:MAG: Ig-like domain-containing protein, partial [Patescibacteria group bacterium]